MCPPGATCQSDLKAFNRFLMGVPWQRGDPVHFDISLNVSLSRDNLAMTFWLHVTVDVKGGNVLLSHA